MYGMIKGGLRKLSGPFGLTAPASSKSSIHKISGPEATIDESDEIQRHLCVEFDKKFHMRAPSIIPEAEEEEEEEENNGESQAKSDERTQEPATEKINGHVKRPGADQDEDEEAKSRRQSRIEHNREVFERSVSVVSQVSNIYVAENNTELTSLHGIGNADPRLINETRHLIRKAIKTLENEGQVVSDLYDAEDFEELEADDWLVTRYLMCPDVLYDPQKAATKIMLCGQYRKSIGMRHWKASEFPREFFEIGELVPYKQDIAGNAVIYIRSRYRRKFEEINEWCRRYLQYWVEQTDRATGGRGLVMVFDCTGVGFENVDLEMLWFMYSSLQKYCPKMLSYVMFYEPPWFTQSLYKVAKSWFTGDVPLIFAHSHNIHKYIEQESLPYFMGGKREPYRLTPPEDALPLKQWLTGPQVTCSAKVTRKIISHFQRSIELVEAEEASVLQKARASCAV